MSLRTIGLAMILAVALTAAARAQCPDGTPPPCRVTAQPPARVALDDNLIAVFPFRVTGSGQDAGTLREGAMDLMALALDEQAGLRVVPSRTLLARARGFTDASPVTDAVTIARGLGAGTMILGSAVIVGSQVRARAELHDVRNNRALSSVEARGSAADPAPVIDSLAAALARVRLTNANTTRRSLQEFASTSPAALRAYLAGERLGRQGRWTEAAESLQVAIRNDSTFGLAYYRLSVAIRYGGAVGTFGFETPIAIARRFESRMPRRQRELLNTVWETQRGVVRDALAQADAVAALYPDDPEALFEQGEAYFHVALPLGEPPAAAERAFARALELDSTNLEPYNHLVELRIIAGDTATAVRLAQKALALAPDAVVQVGTALAVRAIRGEPAATIVGPRTPLNLLGRVILEVQRSLSTDPARGTLLTERLIAAMGPGATRSEQEAIASARAAMLAIRGRLEEAAALTRDPLRRAEYLALAGRALPDSAAYLGDEATRGWHALLRGDTTALRAAQERLRHGPEPFEAFDGALASCLDGLAALARGDSATARAQLAPITDVRPFQGGSAISWECPLALARLELASGHAEAALRHLGGTSFNGALVSRAAMEELRAQALLQRGDAAGAARAWRQFIALWEDADPAFQPRVAAARAALARLTTR